MLQPATDTPTQPERRSGAPGQLDPLAVIRPNTDAIAYTVETADQIARLPFTYLCALSDQTGFVFPHKTAHHWMAGPFTVFGRCLGRAGAKA